MAALGLGDMDQKSYRNIFKQNVDIRYVNIRYISICVDAIRGTAVL